VLRRDEVYCSLSIALSSVSSPGSAVRQLEYQADTLTPANITPTFDNGYLVVYAIRSVLVYGPEGTLAYTIAIPDGSHIPNVAVESDGTSAAAVHMSGQKGRISILSRAGAQLTEIDTGQYQPSYVCFAPDHSIWATGAGVSSSVEEFFILRHYSRDGAEIERFLPRSSFQMRGEPAIDVTGFSGLRAAKNSLGLLIGYGGEGRRPALFLETDLNGKELGRWLADFDGWPAAFTPSGAVYAQQGGHILTLDRAGRTWNPTRIPTDGLLIGADGETLVFMVRGSPVLRWVPLDGF
jgi:hypothetical protein